MNKFLLALSCCILFFVSGCKKEDGGGTGNDQTPPIITLIGDRNVTTPFGVPYADPGAMAYDAVDGDLTDQIIVTTNVDVNNLGSYTVSYNVTDAAGNQAVEVVRDVEVVFSADALEGDWTVTHDCSLTSGVANDQSVESSSDTEITFIGFISVIGLIDFDLEGTIDGSNVTIASQQVNQLITVSGSGTIDNGGTEMTITVTIVNTTPVIGGTETCTLNYVKN